MTGTVTNQHNPVVTPKVLCQGPVLGSCVRILGYVMCGASVCNVSCGYDMDTQQRVCQDPVSGSCIKVLRYDSKCSTHQNQPPSHTPIHPPPLNSWLGNANSYACPYRLHPRKELLLASCLDTLQWWQTNNTCAQTARHLQHTPPLHSHTKWTGEYAH